MLARLVIRFVLTFSIYLFLFFEDLLENGKVLCRNLVLDLLIIGEANRAIIS
jgi:hypothetical protein